MKLSAFITITRPEERGDTYKECIAMANDLCDEVVIIDGKDTWGQEFSWELIGQHFQKGYEQCTGDWVLHLDTDFIFHERDFGRIRQALKDYPNSPGVSFYKHQFILPDRYNLKSRLVLAVNKTKYGDRIKFDGGGESDLCQPSLDGKLIDTSEVPQAGVAFWNYEKITKSEAQIKDDVERMDRAYHRHFKRWLYSDSGRENEAYNGWLEMVYGRFTKPQKHIALEDHPKYIQDTIKNLTPDQFGFNGFGGVEESDYAKDSLRSR